MMSVWVQGEGSPQPRRKPGLYVPVVSPVPDGPARLVLTGSPLIGAFVHWRAAVPDGSHQGRTVPCTRLAGDCPLCNLGRARRWKGWLAAWMDPPARHCLAELTEDAARQVDTAVLRRMEEARGWTIILTRQGARPNSPVRAALTGAWQPVANLPKPCDVRAALCRLWDMDPTIGAYAVEWTVGAPWDRKGGTDAG